MSEDMNRSESLDDAIARRFAAMKRSDLAQLPAAPGSADLALRREQARTPWYRHPSSGLALAASLVVAVLVMWQVPSPQPDAGALYADIMAGATFTTDAFLATGHGLSPESIGTPGVLDFSLSIDEVAH